VGSFDLDHATIVTRCCCCCSRAARGSKHLSRYSFYSILHSSRATVYREVVISHRIIFHRSLSSTAAYLPPQPIFHRSLSSTSTLPSYITQPYCRHVIVLHPPPTAHSRGNMGCAVLRERPILPRSPSCLSTLTSPSVVNIMRPWLFLGRYSFSAGDPSPFPSFFIHMSMSSALSKISHRPALS
jgi:hypothetical protein